MGHSGSHANGGGQVAVAAFKGGQGAAAGGIGYDEHVSPTLGASPSGSNRTPALMQAMQVRRLTPMECERLQGFQDNYTLIPVGKKESADGPRYKALGNSMAVPVMHWIGQRIAFVSKLEGGGK
jgi:DNA (cytosine-5)-methyltransferase 1